jgi:hypothetical protein
MKVCIVGASGKPGPGERWVRKSLRAAFEEDREQYAEGTRQLLEAGFHDPEGILFEKSREAAAAFRHAGGERLLGIAG